MCDAGCIWLYLSGRLAGVLPELIRDLPQHRLLRISQADCVGRDKVAMALPACVNIMSAASQYTVGSLPNACSMLCTCHALACNCGDLTK